MDIINESMVENWLINYFSLHKYDITITRLHDVDVSVDMNYQKNYNAFYVVRRNEKWRKKYYCFLEQNKDNSNINFETIIRYLYDETGNVEPSFSSKMLATIHPNMPIWDQYVLKKLHLKLEGNTKEEKIENAIIIYNQIVAWYKMSLQEDTIKVAIQQFRDIVKTYKISDVKVIDFILWGTRDN